MINFDFYRRQAAPTFTYRKFHGKNNQQGRTSVVGLHHTR